MARPGDIFLGQAGYETLLTPYGRKLLIRQQEIARSGRTAGGRLVTDIVAVKYQFELPYSAIDGDKLREITTQYSLHLPLTIKIYDSNNDLFLSDTGAAPVVKMAPVDRERLLLSGNEGLWLNATLTLDEI